MKKIVFLIFLSIVCVISNAYAQNTHEKQNEKQIEKQRASEVKKVVSQARSAIKTGKNLEAAESAIRKAMNDSVIYKDAKLHFVLFETIRKQYDQGNEKLFLNQKYDTASLFNIAQRMFVTLNNLDSIDSMPDKAGRVVLKYRKSNSSLLVPYYSNLYGGGLYFLNHQKYKESFSCIDTYLSARKWPLFSSTSLPADSMQLRHAAYISLLAGYMDNNLDAALKYSNLALEYKPRREFVLQYMAEIALERQNTEDYLHYLHEGVEEYPKSMYFFPHLIDHYSNGSNFEKALEVADNMIAKDSTDMLCLRIRQTLLLNLGRYDDCIKEGKALLQVNDSLADVNYNVALAYYNKALDIDKSTNMKKQERTKNVNQLYKSCRPYMEKFRQLAPDRKDLWRPVLYNVYLNLNLGKEFTEIESLR